MSQQKKEHVNIVIIGHVDAGKSTTTGHLIFKLGGISDRQLEKLKKEAAIKNRESFTFAFYMDRHKEEQERGVTISCSTSEFFTDHYHYTIIDAPGHRDFIKNMISGASQADVALLMVPADKGGFEKSIARGNHKEGIIEGQTRQHAQLAFLLGIEQLVVGINKMDAPSVLWNEERYNEIKAELTKMLCKVGWKQKIKSIPFVPISGWTGENLIEKSEKMPWYKGFNVQSGGENVHGFTLLDALNDVVIKPRRVVDRAFRMPVSNILKIKGVGNIVCGKIEQGVLKKDVVVRFSPTNTEASPCKGKVFSIEMHHKSVPEAGPGDNVGINVKNLPKENMPRVGDVMYIENDPLDKNPPKKVQQFQAMVVVQSHPGQLKPAGKDGRGGYTPIVHIRTAKVPCQLKEIKFKKGKSTNNTKVENPPYLCAGDQALVTFVPKGPIHLETYQSCPGLGRLAILDGKALVMLGKIMKID